MRQPAFCRGEGNGDMKKVGRNATTREARKGDRGEMQRVKFNLGMTSLPATERTRRTGEAPKAAGEEVLLSSRVGEWVQNCRFLDKWSR